MWQVVAIASIQYDLLRCVVFNIDVADSTSLQVFYLGIPFCSRVYELVKWQAIPHLKQESTIASDLFWPLLSNLNTIILLFVWFSTKLYKLEIWKKPQIMP
jgi:hypothetical protein